MKEAEKVDELLKERQADKEKIKELESDKEIKDKMIDLMINELVFGVFDFKSIKEAKQYFENKVTDTNVGERKVENGN